MTREETQVGDRVVDEDGDLGIVRHAGGDDLLIRYQDAWVLDGELRWNWDQVRRFRNLDAEERAALGPRAR